MNNCHQVAKLHRGEAMYISFIDLKWSSTETESFQ